MQRKITDPLKQLRAFEENARDITGHDIDDRHPRDKETNRKEKTMVEKDQPKLQQRPKGPGAQHVDRQTHYRNLRNEHDREDKKNQGRATGEDKNQSQKFDREEKNQLTPIYNREAEEQDLEHKR